MRHVLLLLALLSLAFAPVPPYRPTPMSGDLKALQGKWLRQSHTNGRDPHKAYPMNDIVLIAGNQITYGFGEAAATPWLLTLGKGTPLLTFDTKLTSDPNSKALLGIYELKGDTLKVCHNISGQRPRSLTPGSKEEAMQVFQRLNR